MEVALQLPHRRARRGIAFLGRQYMFSGEKIEVGEVLVPLVPKNRATDLASSKQLANEGVGSDSL